ncbi:hypothetical protein D3C77_494590 [compost metagenome]
MQLVIAAWVVVKTVGMVQGALPGVPGLTALVLHLEIDGDFTNVMEQGTVGDGGAPGVRLCGLVFRCGTTGEQVGLAQLQAARHQLQAVVEHATRIGMVMAFTGR